VDGCPKRSRAEGVRYLEKYFQAERKDAILQADEFCETARIQEVQDKRELELLRMDNVVGVAPSLKMKGAKPTGEWSLTVLVESKEPKAQVAMAAGGDSGSLLMDANLSAVGLLFAGSAVIIIHNHIADVETALGVRPVTAPRSS
jgi:hypothetical protein